MGDVKSNWKNPPVPIPDMGGAGVTARGGDPNIDTGGTGALKDNWPGATVPVPGGSETPNSVSGMPTQPARFEPSGTPPEPPNLTDRNPGTIDK